MKYLTLLFIFLPLLVQGKVKGYPEHWWSEVPKKELQWWEISPHVAQRNDVILSKRNELGILSNFAQTPFELDGKKYQSVEGFWQSLKYPESQGDERNSAQVKWEYIRSEVEQMTSHQAKKAGDLASENMKKLGINWVTYLGKKMTYRTPEKGEHFQLIKRAMLAKLSQNPQVKEILLKTNDLNLLPDHHTDPKAPPAWKYYSIWMKVRQDLLKNAKASI
ncbi:MAG: NADAR family protein [Halobacteriovoraceae bacterium]|nr:NADAR family protein [Halobacteriovoraceae bacterium]